MKIVKPSVNLIAYTQLNPLEQKSDYLNPEQIVAAAAKLCYSKVGTPEILDDLTKEKTVSFINRLLTLGHESPMEHLNFTFAIEGISRACSHQLVRHRHGSYSQQSQRYVEVDDMNIVVPEEIVNNEQSLKIFMDSVQKDIVSYKKVCDSLVNKMIEENHITDEKIIKQMRKKVLEDARFLLPNACETKIVVTMNARCLFNFFKERCCNRAQWEIREVANQMLDLVLEVAPNVFKYAGASCVYGSCKEGNMSCGKPLKPRPNQPAIQKVKKR